MAMTVTASPSTPGQLSIPPPAPTPPAGTWRHPRLDEIARRQQAATFDSRKLQTALTSAVLFISSFIVSELWPTSFVLSLPPLLSGYPLLLFRIYLLISFAMSLSPFWQPKDDMSDIPLTPGQRQLLGLPPTSAPPTPGSTYSTPPRFARSTPRSSGSRAAVFGSSPLDRSTNDSPLSGSPLAGRGSGSPYGLSGLGTSPASGSTLVRKAVEGRRWSAGGMGLRESLRGSEFSGLGFGDSSGSAPGSPSPSAGGQRGASVALNSKWLYQRGKGSPGGRALYS